MSFVRPSFSHIFLNRRSICSAVSLPRILTLIMRPRFTGFSLHTDTTATGHAAAGGKSIDWDSLIKLGRRSTGARGGEGEAPAEPESSRRTRLGGSLALP